MPHRYQHLYQIDFIIISQHILTPFLVEIHRFLAYECSRFLPALETVTDMHLRDIMSGAKTSLQSYQIKTICVPHYEGLTIKDILAYAQ